MTDHLDLNLKFELVGTHTELDLPKGFGVEQPHGRQLLPQDNGHDGFYYAKLIKVAAQPNGRQS